MATPTFVKFGTGQTAFSGTVTLSFDPGNGASLANPALIVICSAGAATVQTTPTGCTFNGTAMLAGPTGTDPSAAAAGKRDWQAFGLFGAANVPTGAAHNIVATFTATGNDFSNAHCFITALSYDNVNSSATMASAVGHSTISQSPSWALTGAAGDLAIAIGCYSFHTLTGGSGVTLDVASGTLSAYGDTRVVALEKASAASVTVNASISGSGDFWFGAAVNLPQTVAGATTITLSGPGNGTINVQSASFNFGVDATPITGTVVVTPASDKAGTWQAPGVASLSTGNPTAGLTFTPSESGVHTITTTNDGGLADSTPLSFSVASAYTPYNASSILQPTVAQ